MGKGDKKSKRGKIIMGSYGVNRLKKKKNAFQPLLENKKIELPIVETIEEPKVKIAVAKKTTKKEVVKTPKAVVKPAKEEKIIKEKVVKEKKPTKK